MKEETILSLKWHSFHTHLAVSLDTCYEKQQFVDLSLVCKDGTILKCHKMVLANSSPFFRRLLVANDHPHPMIVLHDIEADDLKTIVNFMYCGEIKVIKSEVRRLLKLAEILEVTGLRHIQKSFLTGDNHNSSQEVPKKTVTMISSKIDDSRNSSKIIPNSEFRSKVQNKNVSQSATFVSSSHFRSSSPKISQDTAKRNDDSNIASSSSQRFESSRSNINVIDINDIPSTSKGLQSQTVSKRKTSDESVISWQKILSTIPKDKQLPLKRLCIMDEVEITPGKPIASTKSDTKRDEPLDRRKSVDTTIQNNTSMKCAVFIKDELDVSSELEENADMDPLEIEELESEIMDNVIPKHSYHLWNVDRTYNTRKVLDFPPKKGSNS
ncbi:hypothetical protein M0802_008325 [Mischocyttarus mexicanus]|nr:hypothetical protein M0802_008325 [Mischocyttarus mexicanus]